MTTNGHGAGRGAQRPVKVGTAVNSERSSRRSKARMWRACGFRFELRADQANEGKNCGSIGVTSHVAYRIPFACRRIASSGCSTPYLDGKQH